MTAALNYEDDRSEIEPPVARRLAELSREIAHLSRVVCSAVPDPGGDRDVLFRMVTGEPNSCDPSGLKVPVEGSRLVVVRSRTIDVRAISRETAQSYSFHSCSLPGEGIMFLLVGPQPCSDRRDATAVAKGLLRYDSDARIGISAAIASAADIPSAYRDARELAEMAGPPFDCSLLADDRWAELAVRRLVSLMPQAFPSFNPVQRLRAYDSRRRSNLAESLYTWIMCNCDTGAASAQLFVHPNTLRYRLQRSEEISGLDLQNADERMLFQLAYKASREERHRGESRRPMPYLVKL